MRGGDGNSLDDVGVGGLGAIFAVGIVLVHRMVWMEERLRMRIIKRD